MPVIRKITEGFVIQSFDALTGKFLGQEFVAGDHVEWEDENGYNINQIMYGDDSGEFYDLIDDLYHYYNMVCENGCDQKTHITTIINENIFSNEMINKHKEPHESNS